MIPARKELHILVPPEYAGRRAEHLLRGRWGMAEGYLRSLKQRPGSLMRNGTLCRMKDRLQSGDELIVQIQDPPRTVPIEPAELPLSIVYEDEDLAVIDKSPDVVVHGVPGGPPTLINGLAFLWGPLTPIHPVHRLDRGTSGLLVVAKSAYVQERLRRALHRSDFRREYLALVSGCPEPGEGLIDRPIGREPGSPIRYAVMPEGRSAQTEYTVLKRFPTAALVRLRPLTGRTHQLRVHMAAVGCPLLGDGIYGGDPAMLSRPALHSHRIILRQPVTGELLRLEAPIPADMLRCMERL